MANYGDVRLNLPADWSRSTVFNRQFVNSTVGHKAGVAEVRLEKNPDKRHAFTWVDRLNRQDVDQNRDDGYAFVKKADGWIADRWEWDGESFLICEGQALMAISEEGWKVLEGERTEMNARSIPSDPADDPKLQELADRVKVMINKENQPHKQRARG